MSAKHKKNTPDTPKVNKSELKKSRFLRLVYQPYKWLVFIPLLCLITIIWGSLSIVLATVFNARVGMKLAGRPWAKLNCLAALVSVKIKNKQNIIPGQSYVVVANHQSLFDILVPACTMDLVPGNAEIIIHRPIKMNNYSHDSIMDLIQETRSAINSALS